MVLRNNNSGLNTENTPPVPIKSTGSARRRRTQLINGSRSHPYKVDQAKRAHTKRTPRTLKITVTHVSAPAPVADVEMADAEPSPAPPATTTITLPTDLMSLFPSQAVPSKEALLAAGDELADIDPSYIQEKLETLGPCLLQVCSSTRVPLTNSSILPKEMSILVQDLSADAPTHIFAIHGPQSSGSRRRVQLIPAHNIILAAHCTKLPAYPIVESKSTEEGTGRRFTLPVQPIGLPHPECFPRILAYLYTKNTKALLDAILLGRYPRNLEEDSTQIKPFAKVMAETYTTMAIMRQIMFVKDICANLFVLGVADITLWETLDLSWSVLLEALAISTGAPSPRYTMETTADRSEPEAGSTSTPSS